MAKQEQDENFSISASSNQRGFTFEFWKNSNEVNILSGGIVDNEIEQISFQIHSTEVANKLRMLIKEIIEVAGNIEYDPQCPVECPSELPDEFRFHRNNLFNERNQNGFE